MEPAVSPFKSSSVFADRENQNTELFVRNHSSLSGKIEAQRKDGSVYNEDEVDGVLEVYVHQARDIHNICIYHKQDVYAKLCLTSDPEDTVSTKIVNGGGKNPVFNDNLRLNVRKINSSLKCEIWMLSRVRNYLEDQLLGFALVPLSEVLINNGKLEKEFSLSSTDLFHSPAGFVQLSIAYNGASPDVIAIPAPPTSVANDSPVQDTEVSEPLSSDFDNIEFPDPKIANENHMMVSEYFGIQCTNVDSQNSESLVSSDAENHLTSQGVRVMESFSTDTINSTPRLKHDSPPSSVSTNGSPSALLPLSSKSSEIPGGSKSPNEEYVSPPEENEKEKGNTSNGMPGNTFAKPVVNVNIEPEQKVVQQEIVDMYMKSMQQFTESLAKMKLPMDIGSGPTSSGNSTSDQTLQTSKNNGSRVFYGSRAFF